MRSAGVGGPQEPMLSVGLTPHTPRPICEPLTVRQLGLAQYGDELRVLALGDVVIGDAHRVVGEVERVAEAGAT